MVVARDFAIEGLDVVVVAMSLLSNRNVMTSAELLVVRHLRIGTMSANVLRNKQCSGVPRSKLHGDVAKRSLSMPTYFKQGWPRRGRRARPNQN